MNFLLSIPSPPVNGISLGPFRLHFYALCIVAGIIVAVWLSLRRWRARGGHNEQLESVLVWAVAFGFVGARLYHVITDYQLYFGPGRQWWRAFFIWEGGLGIWGAVALGAVGAWIGARRHGVRLTSVVDVVAPGLLIAQAIGRLGNWFNQELYGRPSTLPWAVEIDPAHRHAGYEAVATYHPTFLYEMVWNLAIAALLLWLDRRYRLGYGKLFWLYVVGYTLGRMWIEHLRIDPVNYVGGFRLNEYTSWIVCLSAIMLAAYTFRRHPGREDSVLAPGTEPGAPQEPGEEPTTESASSKLAPSVPKEKTVGPAD